MEAISSGTYSRTWRPSSSRPGERGEPENPTSVKLVKQRLDSGSGNTHWLANGRADPDNRRRNVSALKDVRHG